VTAAARIDLGRWKRFPHLENKNVEPSAHFSDGDASGRLFRSGSGGGASAKSRGRQKPFPDFRRHM
jgi:hypothetical protein